MATDSGRTQSQRNGVVLRVFGGILAVGVIAILGLAFTNQIVMANHRSAERPHAAIAVQLDQIQDDVKWIRGQLENE